MKPYALFLDIDRTLTADNHIIPKRNIDALTKARKIGHKVIINTGRSFGNIPKEIFEQIDVDGVISGNGTAIMLGGELIETDFMDKSVLDKIAQYCFSHKEYWAVFEGFDHGYNIKGRSRKAAPHEVEVSSYEDFREKSKNDNIQVIAVSSNFPQAFLETVEYGITFYRFDHYYDLTAKGNNKAHGMLKALDVLGIPVERSIAFGDSDNDRNMLIKSGIGVAVANSQPEVLEIADYITLSNEQGGVGAAIEKYILKGDLYE